MKKLGVMLLPIFLSLLTYNITADAVDVTNPPALPTYNPVFVSGLQLSNQLDAIEFYNESDDPVNLTNWSVQYKSITAGQICAVQLKGWILPESYVVAVADSGQMAAAALNPNVFVYESCIHDPTDSFVITIENGADNVEVISPVYSVTPTAFVRKGLTKTYRTGKFSTDFIPINRSLYAGPWYEPLESTQLQISEILVNSRNCSPVETDVECNDYVKIYNPTNQLIDLSFFRLRNGYLGQTPSTSNTTPLSGTVESGHYSTIPASVTDSGGWLWLEDIFGVKRYDNTVQEYPDGSSDTKVGQAWAYDSTDDSWKWTTDPTPQDLPSVFPAIAEVKISVDDSLVPCKVGQYRSLETNRCRNIVTDLNVLIPCEEGKERNPLTNRCRSVKSSTGTLAPCKEGQERNPETNRCRNIVSSINKVDYPVEKTNSNESGIVWSILGVLGLGIGYGIWEWRHEIKQLLSKIFSVFHSSGKLGS